MRCRFIPWLVVALGLACGCTKETVPDDPNVTVQVCNFEGLESAIAAVKGKVVLIDFWATTCPPCVASFPKLVQKHETYAAKGLAVISLSLDNREDIGEVTRFLKKRRAAFTNLLLPPDQSAMNGLRQQFRFSGSIPHAVLLDKAGQLVWTGHPSRDEDELRVRLEAELAK